MAVITTIQLRRGTLAAWTSANPVLAAGEPGFESDTYKLKFGDGVTAYLSLAYFGGAGLSTTLTSAHIYVGNGSNVATDVAVSGDLTLANTGAFTVAKIQTTTVSGTTGSGNVVFSTSPTLVTPALGTPSALVLTNATGGVVAGGGTGVASFTAYAPIFGGTTSTGALQSGTVGTAGQVLTSNGAGALPTFQAATGGGNMTSDIFSGTGAQTAFTLSVSPGSVANVQVYVSGVHQRPTTDYTLSGTTLTFTTAPATGTNNISAVSGTTTTPAFTPVWVLLSTQTASASTTLDFTSVITSTYTDYVAIFENLLTSTTTQIQLTSSTNNGSTYAGNMSCQLQNDSSFNDSAPSYVSGVSNSTPVNLTGVGVNNKYFNGQITFCNPLSAQAFSQGFNGFLANSNGNFYGIRGLLTTASINAIRFQASAGNFTSGKIYLYGIKNT